MSVRLVPYEKDIHYTVPTFLDPRYKNELDPSVLIHVYTDNIKTLKDVPRPVVEIPPPTGVVEKFFMDGNETVSAIKESSVGYI